MDYLEKYHNVPKPAKKLCITKEFSFGNPDIILIVTKGLRKYNVMNVILLWKECVNCQKMHRDKR